MVSKAKVEELREKRKNLLSWGLFHKRGGLIKAGLSSSREFVIHLKKKDERGRHEIRQNAV